MAEPTRWALVDEDGQVDNVVLWDGDEDTWAPPEGFEAVELDDDSPVGPSWTADGDGFEPPPPTIDVE